MEYVEAIYWAQMLDMLILKVFLLVFVDVLCTFKATIVAILKRLLINLYEA
jgi:hypothetical protein